MIGKRGMTQQQLFLIGEALFAIFIFIALMTYVQNVASDSIFEQNFLARDMGLLIDSIYASPGIISVSYDTTIQENRLPILVLKLFPETKPRFAFDNSRVYVFSDSFGVTYQTPATYYFGEDSILEFISPDDAKFKLLSESDSGVVPPNTQSDIEIKNTGKEVSVEFTQLEEHEFEEVNE